MIKTTKWISEDAQMKVWAQRKNNALQIGKLSLRCDQCQLKDYKCLGFNCIILWFKCVGKNTESIKGVEIHQIFKEKKSFKIQSWCEPYSFK